MEYQLGCSFCDELSGIGDNSFFDTFAKIEFAKADLDNRIVAETENFVLMPMVGPLVPMYLLLVSKKHFLSFAHMPIVMLAEAEGIMKKLFAVFSKMACKPVFFEHGPMSTNERGACCSDHAHLHSVAVVHPPLAAARHRRAQTPGQKRWGITNLSPMRPRQPATRQPPVA